MMHNDIEFTQEGHLGIITLNRPAAFNALTLEMVHALQKQLTSWKENPAIHAVVIGAVAGKAFCAGGDIRWLYNAGQGKDGGDALSFFWHEYRLNYFIHQFGKPYIALMDGLTMGGGVGISLHGSHPLASERFVFAMPETGIGFFPDIGASYLLSRCPGALGLYLGLTGNTLAAAQAKKAGLVKQVIPSESMKELINELKHKDLSKEAHARVDECISVYAAQAIPQGKTKEVLWEPKIDSCFSQSSMALVKDSLQSLGGDWGAETNTVLEKKSPLSLKITFDQLQKAKGCSLAECLKMDYDLASHFVRDHDLYEGVRALLIDKDKNPQWKPAHLDQVSEDMLANYFERSDELEV